MLNKIHTVSEKGIDFVMVWVFLLLLVCLFAAVSSHPFPYGKRVAANSTAAGQAGYRAMAPLSGTRSDENAV